MLIADSNLPQKVQSNTKRFRDTMTKAGFTIAGMDHPISPVMLGDAKLASVFSEEMLSTSNSSKFFWKNEMKINMIYFSI